MKTLIVILLGALCVASAAEPDKGLGEKIQKIEPLELAFFAKRLDFEGIPIKSSAAVEGAALVAAHGRLTMLFAGMGAYRSNMIARLGKAGVELHIIGRAEVTTDLPEWRKDKGKPLAEYNGLTRDQRTRGMGGRLVSCGEENLLKLSVDRYKGRDICVHEFAHGIRNKGMTVAMKAEFNAQFKRSTDKGLWRGAYSASNADEFFAELSMWYFGTHGDMGMTGAKPKNGRQGLKEYGPEAYEVFERFFEGRMGE